MAQKTCKYEINSVLDRHSNFSFFSTQGSQKEYQALVFKLYTSPPAMHPKALSFSL